MPVFLWRNLQPDALTILLRYLTGQSRDPADPPAADQRPRAIEASADRREPTARR